MKVSSERLHLIEFDQNLVNKRIMSWFENDELMKYYTSSKITITKDLLLNSIASDKKNNRSYTYFVVNTLKNRIIGTIKIGPINHAHKISDLVALIGDKDGLGKGVGTEAVKLGIKQAFHHHNLRKLFSGMYASNIASIKAYTNAGWIVEGVLKGHYIVNDKNEDRILVGCFNPKYFSKEYVEKSKFLKWYGEK